MITLDSPELKNISPEKLGELMIEAKKAYYNTGKPIMDDHTWDILEDTLRKKLPYHRIFTKVGSHHFNTGFDKKSHSMPMGSQNKINRLEDLIHYFELKKIPQNTEFVVQPKCDGISLEIIYKNGELVESITRGDGHIGDVITQNIVKMKKCVTKINENFSGAIRCEIVMLNDDFEKLNKLTQKNTPALSRSIDTPERVEGDGEGFYSNSRNAASGISQRLDGQYAEFCSLYAVDIFSPSYSFSTETEKINFLNQHGFTTVDNFLCQNFDQIEEIYQQFLNKNRGEYPFEIDGLVIKINDLQLQHQLGSKNNRPKGQVAYKFPSRSSQTRIINIDWQVGPMGTITPVAQVDPIEISGAIITFASLANYDLIKEKNINIDDIVEIQRRGDVIPHVEQVITKINSGHISAPIKCPSCHTPLIHENKFLKCPNISKCSAQILGSLRLFCDTLEIKGISDKTIAKLYQLNLIKLPGDFYRLQVSDFENIAGLGNKSGSNIVREIQAKKTLTLKQILDAAIIPNFSSQRIIQIINAGFDTPEKILSLTVSQLEALPGIKITLAEKIYQGIQSRRDFIQSILNNVTIHQSKILNHESKIFGKNFAITGTLSIPRKSLEEKIISLGGKLASSVTSNTDYLITNEIESDSSKFVNAKKFGTQIISEVEFSQLAE
ncbi:MAG: NAD-dependent DNA ligase LigA [Candidatus Shapirobacteria bacterium]|nr:NAD-dependent DNA ligase LigA [Candidatus Shapirobacteria bacterium]